MPSREIEAGPVLAAGGGVVVIVSLFLDWFGGGGQDFTGWEAFEALDLVLAALGLTALAALALPDRVPLRVLPAVGIAAFVVVASQLINHPPVGLDRDTEMGAWLALGGSLPMLVGGALSVARVSLAVNVAERPGYAPPPPPPAPAPQPGAAQAPGPEDSTQRLPGE